MHAFYMAFNGRKNKGKKRYRVELFRYCTCQKILNL